MLFYFKIEHLASFAAASDDIMPASERASTLHLADGTVWRKRTIALAVS